MVHGPKLGHEASPEWVDYFRRKTEHPGISTPRSGKLSDNYLVYYEAEQAAGREPLSFTRWMAVRDDL